VPSLYFSIFGNNLINQKMILTLFIISGLLFLFGLYSFWKKKGIIGVFSVLVGLLGIALGIAVVYFYPDKLGF